MATSHTEPARSAVLNTVRLSAGDRVGVEHRMLLGPDMCVEMVRLMFCSSHVPLRLNWHNKWHSQCSQRRNTQSAEFIWNLEWSVLQGKFSDPAYTWRKLHLQEPQWRLEWGRNNTLITGLYGIKKRLFDRKIMQLTNTTSELQCKRWWTDALLDHQWTGCN